MNKIKSEVEILEKLGISQLNEMQQATKEAYKHSNNLLLLSPTGSGKTLAFLLPILNAIDPDLKEVQALIIVPARELALQIEQVIRNMGSGVKVNAFYGGRAGAKDKIDLNHPPAILVGTPGRLAAHFERGSVNPHFIHNLVLDEFDKSLEIGFDDDMIFILDQLTMIKKTILTSATFGVEIPDFVKFDNPIELNFLSESKKNLTLELVYSDDKGFEDTLINLLHYIGNKPGIIFCNYKDSVEGVGELLKQNNIDYGIFHGGMEQRDRERTLIKFRNGSHQLLVATDLAARGIDISDLNFIIHFQLPHREEDFVHRNGRTARMHASGTAYIMLTKSSKVDYLPEKKPLTLQPINELSPSAWATLFVSGGRKDKISKGDLVGLLMKQGGLSKDEIGVIELNRDCAFIGIKKEKSDEIVNQLNNTRLKKKKVRLRLV